MSVAPLTCYLLPGRLTLYPLVLSHFVRIILIVLKDSRVDTSINDVLCFVSTARESWSKEKIIKESAAFYSDDHIKKAKDLFFELCDETAIKRKVCPRQPNVSIANLEDIYNLFEKMEGSSRTLPKFVAEGFMSLPPSSGFDSLASILCMMRDEISALRFEVTEFRKSNSKDQKAFDNVNCVLQDVAEIKRLIHLRSAVFEGESSATKATDNVSDGDDLASQTLPVDVGSYITAGDSNAAGNYEGNLSTVASASNSNVNNSQPTVSTSSVNVGNSNSAGNAGMAVSAVANAPTSLVQSGRPTVVTSEVQNAVLSASSSNSYSGALLNATNGPTTGPSSATMSTGQRQRGGAAPWAARRGRGGAWPQRRPPLRGTRTASAGLVAAVRTLDVFVSGCGLDTTEDCISAYCRNNGVAVNKCESLPTRSRWCKCFKINANPVDRDRLMSPDLWPEGIIIKKFFPPSRAYNTTS